MAKKKEKKPEFTRQRVVMTRPMPCGEVVLQPGQIVAEVSLCPSLRAEQIGSMLNNNLAIIEPM